MKKMILAILSFTLPVLAQGNLPLWVRDAWRSTNYPANEWYVGFSQNVLPSNANVGEALKALERTAQSSMAESIIAFVSSNSESSTGSSRRQQGEKFDETINRSYVQTIQVSTNANIAKTQFFSHHDFQTNRIYAMAVVKKSDLTAYYISQVELLFKRAETGINEAKQLTQLNRKSDALKKLAESRSNLDECGQYLNLLSVVDPGGASNRLLTREATLRKQITAIIAETEEAKLSMSFYVNGKETIEGEPVNIVISKLKSIVSKNGYRITDAPKGAAYNLRLDVKSCNVTTGGAFIFCYACVRVDVINLETGKKEGSVDFTGPKTGWRDRGTACRKALEGVADEIWKKINSDIKIFK